MTTFLDDLERELRAAHPRRRRAARRAAVERNARKAPAAMATVAVIGGATAFVVSTGDEPATNSAAQQTGADYPADLLPDDTIATINGTTTPGLARAVAEFLEPRHRVAVTGDVTPVAGSAPTTIYYEPGHEREARRLGGESGFAWARMTDRIRDRASGARLAIEVRQDVTGGRTVALNDAAGRKRGSLTTLEFGGRRFAEITSEIERSRYLAAWLRGPEGARFLGFIAEPLTDKGETLAVAQLPEGDRWPELVISRETKAEPGDAPANVLLTATLDG